MTEPSRGYHGVNFYETFGDFGFTMKARMETMRTLGPTLVADVARCCCCRASRRCTCACSGTANRAGGRAASCARIRAVGWVNYPRLAGQSGTTRWRKRYLPRGAGGILTFGVKGGAAAGVRFIEAAQFLCHLANIGDAKTLVIHPASTTHRQLDEDEQRAAGVLPDMIRLSVGLERSTTSCGTSTRRSRITTRTVSDEKSRIDPRTDEPLRRHSLAVGRALPVHRAARAGIAAATGSARSRRCRRPCTASRS